VQIHIFGGAVHQMKTYNYTAKDLQGNQVKGSTNCEDYNAFVERMQERNLFVINYKEVESTQAKSLKKFKTAELAFDCRQLSAMMSAGLSLVKALDILYHEQAKDDAKQVWLEVYEEVQKGQSFSEALKMQRGAFPPFLISMVNAGESSGSLDTVMQRMADHYAKENKMNNKIKGSLTYPIILFSLTIVIGLVLCLFVLPMFVEMFGDAELPATTQALINIVDFAKKYWYIVILVVLGIVAFVKYLFTMPNVCEAWDKFIIKVPAAGPLVVKIYTGRFARTLSSLYSSGIPMVECLERSSDILNNTYISKLFETVIAEVKQGEPLSLAIQRTGIFESMFCSIILVGEESGALDDILLKCAEFYEDEADTALAKLVTFIEPVIIIFMGVMVGFVLAAILPAMYSSYENIA